MLAVATLAIVLLAVVLCHRQARRVASERRDILRDCAGLFDAPPRHDVDRAGFGRLTGQVRGCPVHVGVLAEALAFRRLPQLWLRIEIRTDMGTRARLDVVRRPANVEFYAPAADFEATYAVPPGWPPHTLVKGSADAHDCLQRLADHGGRLIADPRLKEILVTPNGLRVTAQACEGDRGTYLLLRGTRFSATRIDPSSVSPVLDEALTLAHALRSRSDDTATVDAALAAAA